MSKTICICLTIIFIILAICATIINTSQYFRTVNQDIIIEENKTKFSVGQTIFDTYIVISVETENNCHMYYVYDKATFLVHRIFETNGVYSCCPVYDEKGFPKKVEHSYFDAIPEDIKFQKAIFI